MVFIILFIFLALAFLIGVVILYYKALKLKLNRLKEVRQKEADIHAIRQKLEELDKE